MPTESFAETARPLCWPVPLTVAVFVITLPGRMPPLTVTSNVTVADAPAAIVPRLPPTPEPWLPVIVPCVNVRLPA